MNEFSELVIYHLQRLIKINIFRQGTFNWGSYEQGFMFSAFFVGALIATLPAGWLADRYNPKMMVTISICFTSAGCFLSPITAIEGNYIGLVILRFIMGFFGQVSIINLQVLLTNHNILNIDFCLK